MNGRAAPFRQWRLALGLMRSAGSLLPALGALLVLPAAAAPATVGAPAAAAAAASYRSECAACHLAYPPELLPQASWKRLMANLPHHFGVDASLDPEARAAVESWLLPRAAAVGEQAADGRITRLNWFRSEHAELPASVWQRQAVRSASNCSACHSRAEQGDFDEDHVHVPR